MDLAHALPRIQRQFLGHSRLVDRPGAAADEAQQVPFVPVGDHPVRRAVGPAERITGAVLRVVGGRLDDFLFVQRMGVGLIGGNEGRAHHHPGCAERHQRPHVVAVGDAPRRQHRSPFRDGKDRGEQRHDADRASIEMPAAFTALGDDDVRALGDGDVGQLHRPRLHHNDQPGVLGPGNHVGGILLGVEQRQQLGLFLEDYLKLRFEHIRTTELRHQVHPEGLISQCAGFLYPAAQGQGRQAQAADNAHAAGIGHGAHQLRTGNRRHAAKKNRVLHAAKPGNGVTGKIESVLVHDSQLHMFAQHPLERVVLQEKVILYCAENMQREPGEKRRGADVEQHVDHMLQRLIGGQYVRNPQAAGQLHHLAGSRARCPYRNRQ
ncbi:hypothetical protein D3C85_1031510 [compost metagenome]